MQPEPQSPLEVAPGIVRRSDRGLSIAGKRNRQRQIDASKHHFTPEEAAAWARLMSLKRTEMIS